MMKKLLFNVLLLLMTAIGAVAQTTVTIGEGTSTQYYPLPGYYGWNYDVFLYTPTAAAALGADCDISSIAFNVSTNSTVTGSEMSIWVKDVDANYALAAATTFADYTTDATLVYENDDLSTTTGWNTFDFFSDFSHEGGKALLVAVRGEGCTANGGCSRYCTYTSASNTYWYNRKDNSDPGTSASGTISSNRANIQLELTYTGAVCLTPSGLATSNLTHNSATLSWSENGNATAWVLQYGTDNTFASGTYTETSVNVNPVNLTGLNALTTYYVRVKPDCDTEGSHWSSSISFTTAAVATEVGDGWSDNFEGATCGWELVNGALTNAWAWGTAANNGGTHALYISNDGGITNAYNVSGGTVVYATKFLNFVTGKYEFSYDWIANGESTYDFLRVALVPASVTLTAGTYLPSGLTTTAVPTGWIALDGGSKLNLVTEWQSKALAVNITAGNYYLVFVWRDDTSGGSQPPAAIDNVIITRIACEYDVTNLAVSDITTTGATLAWTAGEASQWQVAYSTSSDFAGAIEEIVSAPTYNMTSLTSASTYYVKVRAYCGGTDFGAWSSVLEFNTACDAITSFPWSENFDGFTLASVYTPISRTLPVCWNFINECSNSSYMYYPTMFYNSYTDYSHSTPNSIRLYSYYYNDPQPQYIILPAMENLSTKRIELWAMGYDASSTFKVGLMTDPTDASTFVQDGEEHELTTSYQKFTIDLTGSGNYIAIMIDAANTSRNYNGMYIDDITVMEQPSCLEPTALSKSNVTARTVDLSWTTGATETAWQICLNDNEENLIDVNTNSYTLTGLNPITAYNVKVRAKCSESDFSEWTSNISFTTTVACPVPTALAYSDISNTSATVSWTAGASEGVWNLKYKKTADDEWTEVNGLTSSSYTLTSLTSATAYSVQVQTDCELDGTSYWLSGSFTTAYGIPFVEEFGTSSIPANWSRYQGLLSDVLDGTAYTSYSSGWNFGSRNIWGSTHAYINVYGTSNKYWLVTPVIAMDANVQLTFNVALTAWNNANAAATNGTDDKFVVLISTDNGETWTILRQYDNASSEYVYNDIPTAGEEVAIDLSSYSSGSVMIAFYTESTESNADNDIHIDNVNVDYIPSCTKPTDLVKSNVTARTVDLSWTAGGTETVWQICLNNEEDNLVEANTNPYTLTGLSPETAYNVKVRANCGGDVSAWTNNISFTTTVACPVPTALTCTGVTATTATLSWTAGASETAWQICINNNEDELVDVTEKPYTLTGLDPATTYSVKVRANCGDTDGNSQWTSAVQFTTECEAISSLPYEQGFESAGVPTCWTKVGAGTVAGTSNTSYSNYSYTGSYYLKFSGTTGNNIIAMPQFEESISSLVLDFYTRPESNTSSNCGTFEVGYISDLTDVATFVALDTYSYDDWASTSYEKKTVKMTSAPAGSYIALNHKAASTAWYWFVDDVTVREASHAAEILTYSLPTQQIADATIDPEHGTIAVTVAFTTDLNALAPEYTISDGAEISAPTITGEGDVRTIAYTVTAEAGNTKDWTVRVTKAPVSHDAFITAFTFAGQKAGSEATIVSDTVNGVYTVNAVAEWNTVLTAVAPTVTISAGAQVTPASGASQDFTTPVTYTVTAEDGTTQHAYTVNIVNDPDACITPATVYISNITTNTATATWEQAYTETSYRVKVSTGFMANEEDEADIYDDVVEALTLNIEGLEANTEYFVYVQSNCDNAETWAISSFRTECEVLTIDAENPYTEGFETTDEYEIPYCWERIVEYSNGDIYPYVYVDSYHYGYAHNGQKSLYMYTSSFYSAPENVIALPEMNAINTLFVSFYAKSGYTAPREFEIGYIKNGEFTSLKSFALTTNFQEFTALLNEAPADAERIAIRSYHPSSSATVYVDDITVRIPSNEAEIVDFYFPTRMTAPVINSEAGTITTTASYQANLDALGEEVTVSEAATFVGTSWEVNGNVKTLAYTVTAEDRITTKNWTVTVTKADAASPETDIVAFTFYDQSGESVIDTVNHTVTAYAQWNFDLENHTITPTIEVSPMATISNDGEARNFFGSDETPVQYTVTAEDGTTTQLWNVTIVNDPYACVNPTAINADEVTATTATLSWDKMYLENSYLVKVSTTPMTDMTAEADVYDDVVTLAENADEATLALTDLSAATIHYVYVQSNCENAEDWTFSYFATECDGSAYDLPFVETFELDSRSVLCWTTISNNTANDETSSYGYGLYEYDEDNIVFRFSSYSSASDYTQYLITPELNVTGPAILSFDYAKGGYSEETFQVMVSSTTNDVAAFTDLGSEMSATSYDFATYTANIPADTKYIAIKYTTNYQYYLYIDNFEVTLPTYTITATAGENGIINPEGEITVIEGENKEFTITPAEGYRIATLVVDAETEGEDDVADEVVEGDGVFFYTFENVTANHTIHATFELIPTYTITVEAGENGNVYYNDALVSAPIVVTEGATPEFEITPETGYEIDVLSVGGNTVELTEQQLGGLTYTFDPVMADITLTVTFKAIPATTHTIQVIILGNGSVTYGGEELEDFEMVTVAEGATPEFTMIPAEGYMLAEIAIGEADAPSDVEADVVFEGEVYDEYVYTFDAVTSDMVVFVTFVPPTRTVTFNVGEHGTVSVTDADNNEVAIVDGVITVNYLDDLYLEITPDENYKIETFAVNGVVHVLDEEDELGLTWPMLEIRVDMTVSVTFTSVIAADMLEAGSMTVYPNPNNGMFSIDFSNIEGDATYQIINASGAVVETRDINVMNGETMNFNHDLRPGTYFVRIINGDKVYVEQIVVE